MRKQLLSEILQSQSFDVWTDNYLLNELMYLVVHMFNSSDFTIFPMETTVFNGMNLTNFTEWTDAISYHFNRDARTNSSTSTTIMLAAYLPPICGILFFCLCAFCSWYCKNRTDMDGGNRLTDRSQLLPSPSDTQTRAGVNGAHVTYMENPPPYDVVVDSGAPGPPDYYSLPVKMRTEGHPPLD